MNSEHHNKYRKLAVIDIDGTLIKGQSQRGLINFFYRIGRMSLVDYIRLNIWFILYKSHIITDLKSAYQIALKNICGEKVEVVDDLVERYVKDEVSKKIFPKSNELIDRLQDQGYDILFLSAAVDLMVMNIAKLFGVNSYLSTKLEIKDNKYTGKIDGEVIYGNVKNEILESYVEKKGYLSENVIAYADHLSDIPLLKMVGKGYMVNPDERTRGVALDNELDIIYTY